MTQTTDRTVVDADFSRLETLLKANPLPKEGGGHRLAKPDEFMWMYVDVIKGVGFKHCDTRRYVYVSKRCGVDVLTVEAGSFFDSFEE
jgi:hypothetical protein